MHWELCPSDTSDVGTGEEDQTMNTKRDGDDGQVTKFWLPDARISQALWFGVLAVVFLVPIWQVLVDSGPYQGWAVPLRAFLAVFWVLCACSLGSSCRDAVRAYHGRNIGPHVDNGENPASRDG